MRGVKYEMHGCQRSLNFSSSKMKSDEECDAVIVAAAMIEHNSLGVEGGFDTPPSAKVKNIIFMFL